MRERSVDMADRVVIEFDDDDSLGDDDDVVVVVVEAVVDEICIVVFTVEAGIT